MRRTRKLALTAAAALLVTGAAVGIDELFWHGAHAAAVASAVADAATDPGSIFAERSPGARGSGWLAQTKPDRIALAPGLLPLGPEERVLAEVRERPPETELALGGPPPALSQMMQGPDFGGPFPPTQNFPSPPPGGAYAPPLLNGPLTPPNSQSTPPGGPPPPNQPPGQPPPGGGPPPLTPVPEPDAWMLMILALFSVGAALRCRRTWRRVTQDAPTRFDA